MTLRYPFAVLAEAMGVSENQAVMRLGINGKAGQQYRAEGMTEKVADRMAVKAGLHPFEVWPEMAVVNMEEAERLEQERLERRRRIARESARRRYHEDPEIRARKLAATRAYKATTKRARDLQPHRSPKRRQEANRRFYRRHAERLKAEQRTRYATRRAA